MKCEVQAPRPSLHFSVLFLSLFILSFSYISPSIYSIFSSLASVLVIFTSLSSVFLPFLLFFYLYFFYPTSILSFPSLYPPLSFFCPPLFLLSSSHSSVLPLFPLSSYFPSLSPILSHFPLSSSPFLPSSLSFFYPPSLSTIIFLSSLSSSSKERRGVYGGWGAIHAFLLSPPFPSFPSQNLILHFPHFPHHA